MCMKITFYILSLLLVLLSCHPQPQITNLDVIPEITAKDRQYENAYKLLDGKWKGNFQIFEDKKRVSKEMLDLKLITTKSLEKEGITLVDEIEVEQIYTSETPFFQRVTITDYYPKTGKKVAAKGVNKVQNGKLLCVVIKPNDTVVHDGYLEKENTIIWQRNEKTPQKVEYFRETVDQQFYEIIGWGYYDGDDLSLSPKFWFYGKYERAIR